MHFIQETLDKHVPLSRPSTSSGQRRLSQAPLTSNLGPSMSSTEENASINNELIDREVEGDDLLRILRRDDIELQNELFILAEQGDYKKFKAVIDGYQHHIDLTKFRGLHGFTLLHHAASRGHSSIVLELLKNNRESVHLRNDMRETPLHLAAYHGHLLLVDLLLDYNADINAINKDGETCLFYAIRRKMPAVVRLLIQRGINTEIRDIYGDLAEDASPTPIHHMNSMHANASSSPTPLLHQDILTRMYSYLPLNDLFRSACVCRKWHMISGGDEVWKGRGGRRWEVALTLSLGFSLPTTFTLLKRTQSGNGRTKDPGREAGGSSQELVRENSARSGISPRTGGGGIGVGGRGGSIVLSSSDKYL
eukprot:gene28824-34792_t